MFNVKSSPIFNLSMASKELFHSNMLYWISTTYHAQFISILEMLGVSTKDWPSNWKSYRENNHFDLSITNEKEDEYLFVLENKVKSIAYLEQLDRYKNSVKTQNTKWMLLSLATDLSNSDEIKNNGWDITNYQDLAFAIYRVIPSINNCYHRQLLEDYCACILSLHEMQRLWTYNINKSYLSQFVNDASNKEDLGMEDVRKKVLYSRLAADLQKKLNAKIHTNKEIDKEKSGSQPGEVYVNSGMTRATGLIDIKIRIEGNLLFVIQLQGVSYKYCIETLDMKGDELEIIKAFGLTLENKSPKSSVPNSIKKLTDKFFSTINGKKDLSSYPFDEGKIEQVNSKKKNRKTGSSAYNKYGETFIYQYIKIAEATTVKNIVDAIVKDVENIKNCIISKSEK